MLLKSTATLIGKTTHSTNQVTGIDQSKLLQFKSHQLFHYWKQINFLLCFPLGNLSGTQTNERDLQLDLVKMAYQTFISFSA